MQYVVPATRSQPVSVGLSSRNWDTVVFWAAATEAQVSPAFALYVLVQALASSWAAKAKDMLNQPRARRNLEETMIPASQDACP